jgi:hypothetical protein
MTVVYSSAFNATVDTNLNAFGGPDWYIVRMVSGEDIKVIAADDNVQLASAAQVNFSAGLVHSLIGGVDDYLIRALVRRATVADMGMLAVRCGGIASSNMYVVGCDSNNDIVLWRHNGGGPVILKVTSASIPENAKMTVTLGVSGTNPVVLTYSVDGVYDTFSDSSGSRHTSGPFGVALTRVSGAAQAAVWVDNIQASDDLSGADFVDLFLGNLGPAMFGSINNEPHRQPTKPVVIEKVPQNPAELLAREAEIRRKMELAADLRRQSRDIDEDQRLRAAIIIAERLNRFR